MAVNIYLKAGSSKDGKTTLYIHAQHKGKIFKKALPFRIYPKDWLKNKYQVKDSSPGSIILNRKLRELDSHLKEVWDIYMHGAYSWEELCLKLGKVEDNQDVENFIKNSLKQQVAHSTYETYFYSFKALLKAIEKSSISFKELNQELLDAAVKKWKKEKKSEESIKTYVKHIIRLSNQAYERGVLAKPLVSKTTYKSRQTTRIIESATTEDLIKAINKVQSLKDFQCIAFWLLMFCMRGLYPKDFMRLGQQVFINENELNKNRYVKHNRSKTGEPMQILLSCEPTESIFNSLQISLEHNSKNRTILGHEVYPKKYNQFQFFNYREEHHKLVWDTYIKGVKKLLGYSFKVARKTFETYSLKIEATTEVSFRLLGHQDKTIKRYYRNWEWEELVTKVDEAHLNVLSAFDAEGLWRLLLQRAREIGLPPEIYDGSLKLD